MKRFLLFLFHQRYPQGGWNDFKGDFDTKEEASAKARESEVNDGGYHVVDAKTFKVVVYGSIMPEREMTKNGN